jgi:FAD/FMN-containing dehydrogenase
LTYFARCDGLLSWGRVLRAKHLVGRPSWRDELAPCVASAERDGHTILAVGLRRSYGDSCLNPNGVVLDMTHLDRLIAFDPQTRLLRAEAGISLDMLLRFLVPRGFFLPVTPGTRFVTLGGAVANDVHGKNHHGAGTLGCWVRRFGLLRGDGEERELDRSDQTGLFAATIGGLGLTGVITWVEIEVVAVPSAIMDVETVAFGSLADFFHLAGESETAFDYTVAWIDCMARGGNLGRGLFSRGRHAQAGGFGGEDGRSRITIPADFPNWTLNSWSVRAFNAVYYRHGRHNAGRKSVGCQTFFYPLDMIGEWNRIYGRQGLYQYQSVVPPETAQDATKAMLTAISECGEGSFLAVLKTFGDTPPAGMMSFPRKGTTLALDFPNHGTSTLLLMDRLDSIVREAGGRLYAAKDGRIPAAMFRAGYPQWEAFRDHVDPHFSSHFWARVGA